MTDREKEEIHSEDSDQDDPSPQAHNVMNKSHAGGGIYYQKSAMHRKTQKSYSKIIKTVLNIVYLGLKGKPYEDLQSHEGLLTQLIVYLNSDLSSKSRDKELIFVFCSLLSETEPI